MSPYTHKYIIENHMSERVLCPLAAIAMVVIAMERGWRPKDKLFKYIKFSKALSAFTRDGTITTFELV